MLRGRMDCDTYLHDCHTSRRRIGDFQLPFASASCIANNLTTGQSQTLIAQQVRNSPGQSSLQHQAPSSFIKPFLIDFLLDVPSSSSSLSVIVGVDSGRDVIRESNE